MIDLLFQKNGMLEGGLDIARGAEWTTTTAAAAAPWFVMFMLSNVVCGGSRTIFGR